MQQILVPLVILLQCAVAISQLQPDTTLVISPYQLAARISGAHELVVIDAREPAEFQRGHIPGARNAPWQRFCHMQSQPGDSGYAQLLPLDSLATILGELGITASTPVIAYAKADGGWGEEGYIVWLLRSLGHSRSAILDGGISGWKKLKQPLTRERSNYTPQRYSILAVDSSWGISTPLLADSLQQYRILDSRSAAEFNGRTPYGEARGGHIPTAHHLYFKEVFQDNGYLRTPGELSDYFYSCGLQPQQRIVSYCTGGIRSAHLTVVLRFCGFYRSVNYDASFWEWSARTNLPLSK
jgi:thiosulfate/3-mercaptopyruvate sulfurtransferase